jgi:hypothetical protein
MAAALATLVLDEEVMTMVRQRGEAPIMFSACMQLLRQTLDVSGAPAYLTFIRYFTFVVIVRMFFYCCRCHPFFLDRNSNNGLFSPRIFFALSKFEYVGVKL